MILTPTSAPYATILTLWSQDPKGGTVPRATMARTEQQPQQTQAGSRERRFVTEAELMDSLNRSLWEVERERATESNASRR